jgi:hypothetical protein
VGRGIGRGFCSGGDVASEFYSMSSFTFLQLNSVGVIQDASNDETRPRALSFFKRECVSSLVFVFLPLVTVELKI